MKQENQNEIINNCKLLIPASELMMIFDNMSKEITNKLADTNPIMLPIMNGAFMVASELSKRLKFPMQMDHINIMPSTISQDKNVFSLDCKKYYRIINKLDLKNRNILLIEGIIDSGITLNLVIKYCLSRGCNKIYTAVMLNKNITRSIYGLKNPDFSGQIVENKYIIGFGLDYDGYLRNLDQIYAIL
jgi:hypoxanthine phosphoribosyltransferase